MIHLNETLLEEIETPCIVIDTRQTQKNIEDMQKVCDRAGCHLRPHIKTHKMKDLALQQIKAGAFGISCAKLGEAEIMAEAGIEDIFIAYPIVSKVRLEKARQLNQKIKRLILGVDSVELARELSKLGEREDQTFEVRLEIDTGAKRSGASLEKVASIASEIWNMEHVHLTGIYTFKSLVYQGEATTDALIAAKEEAELMHQVQSLLHERGIGPLEISAGSSPTGKALLQYDYIDEIRPGTYIFNDEMMVREKTCQREDIAAYIIASVVSVRDDGNLIVDGGSKAFSTDIILNQEPYLYEGYAICEDENYTLSKLNEEHGYLFCKQKEDKYKVGDKLMFIPIHICTTINLYNHVYFYDGITLEKKKVDARGQIV